MPITLRRATATSMGQAQHDVPSDTLLVMLHNYIRHNFEDAPVLYQLHFYTFSASVVDLSADTTTSNPTRRERKKAATRPGIADAALELFLERGFDNVSVREIADATDVSPTTVFAHFPCKEAIATDEDEDDEMRERLTSAVTDRPDAVSILDALRKFYREDAWHDDSLSDYAQKIWLPHENSLADAIAADLGQQTPDVTIRAFARCALQAPLIESTTAELPAVVNAVFDLLEPGWES